MAVSGFVAPGYERVKAAFEENFAARQELGAAFAVYRNGEPVVDLWGGVADRASGRPWTEDTLQLFYSGTKGLVATCLLMLIERGRLRLDAPVATYWPEFGKPEVLVRDVVSHTARLSGIDTPITVEDLFDDRKMAAILAAQARSTDPRSVLTYHGLTYGWLCGEIIRRVDGRSVGRFFAEEVAGPLGVEVWIGLPEAEEGRVSTLELASNWGEGKEDPAAAFARDPLLRSTWGNPVLFDRDRFFWNERALHAAEVPGGNGIGTMRGIAKVYGCLATGGAPLLKSETVQLGRTELSAGYDSLNDVHWRFGVGFQLPSETIYFGPAGREVDAFGHDGAGGSHHGAWPALGIGYSYAMNRMRDDSRPNVRAQALLEALHAAATA